MQVDARAGEVDGGHGRTGAIEIQSGGVRALAAVAVQVELDGEALGDAVITKASTRTAEGRRPNVLNGERHPVGGRIGQLERKIGHEGLDVHRGGVESAAGLVRTAIGQLQPEVVQVGAAIELHWTLGKREALAEVDGVNLLNRVSGAHHRTGEQAWGDGDRLDGLPNSNRQGQRLSINRGGGRRCRPVQGVVDDRARRAIGDGKRLRSSVGTAGQRKYWIGGSGG